jgi:hypothetical protein
MISDKLIGNDLNELVTAFSRLYLEGVKNVR